MRHTPDDRLDGIFSAPDATYVRAPYPHWDQLIRRPPPEGLSHKEWWLALKLRRSSGRQEIPLKDSSGNLAFSYVLAKPLPERLHAIDLGAGGQIGMQEPITNPATKDRYYLNSLMAEAIKIKPVGGSGDDTRGSPRRCSAPAVSRATRASG